MTLKRGFKAQANGLALEVRTELGLAPYFPLCPWKLAEHLCIPVLTLQELVDPEVADHIQFLAHSEPSVFSATTIFHGSKRRIVHNHGHAPVRQRSNLAHEIAHALLQHPPHELLCSSGERVYERALEEEAAWLGPLLLVSNEAAYWAMANNLDLMAAANHFKVSEELMEFRFRMSGAKLIKHRRKSRVPD